MANLDAAAAARAAKHLDQLVRTSSFGVVTRKRRLDLAIAAGATLEVASVRDEARERSLQREIETMRKADNGWYVPTGNSNHPLTIKFNKLKADLAAGPKTIEYRLHQTNSDGEFWNILTKIEYDYAVSIKIAAA
jgi:hypothetical protein